MKRSRIWAVSALVLSLASVSWAFDDDYSYDDWIKNYTIQALAGAAWFDNLEFDDVSGSGDPGSVDLSTIPQVGGAWGTLPKGGTHFQYGLETTFLLGFRSDDVSFRSANGLTHISIDASMWMFDLSGGAYLNLFLDEKQRFRLYVGAGPLMMYSEYDSDRDEDNGTEKISYDNDDSAFGLGVYGRAGFEFRVYEKGMLGVGVRGNWADLDFTDVGGDSSLSGIAAFVTFTAGL